MPKKGFTLVEIMIVVAIIAILAAVAIPNLLTAKRTANTAAAKANVRSLSTAAEIFATAHGGAYPSTVELLVPYAASAARLCASSTEAPVQGYLYDCTDLATTDYTITATPSSVSTGDTIFTVTTGGVIAEAAFVPAEP